LFVGASFGSLVEAALRPAGFTTMCIILAGCLLSATVAVGLGVKEVKTSE
jgi:hypothetical protein